MCHSLVKAAPAFVLAFCLTTALAKTPGLDRTAASPLSFEAGASENPGFFRARGLNYEIKVTASGAQVALRKSQSKTAALEDSRHSPVFPVSGQAAVLALRFINSNPAATLNGSRELPGKINYFLGSSPSQWRTGLKTYGSVTVRDLYPGVDMVYYGNQDRLEYDLVLQPGTDPAIIVLQVDGAEQVVVGGEGNLAITLNGERIIQHQPRVYQVIDGQRRSVPGRYVVLADKRVGFAVGQYDRKRELIIDPVLSYSTYFGGQAGDLALSVKLDGAGNIYVAGETLSTELPFPVDGLQTNFAGGQINGDAFVAKFDPAGASLIYFTYLGGRGNDGAHDLAVDAAGNAYIAGFTDSPDFPVTAQAYHRAIGGKPTSSGVYFSDAFVAKLDPTGGALVFSTYFGGEDIDVADAVAVDPAGFVYVAGYTYSTTTFPTLNPLPGNSHLRGVYDAFVAKFDPSGSSLVYSTYLGGGDVDEGQGIAADSSGFAYVTGYTASSDFPTTNAFRTVLNGAKNLPLAYDAFITKIAPGGNAIDFSTLLGGTNTDSGFRLALDSANNIYVTGGTRSADFPNTISNDIPIGVGFTNNKAANYDSFLAKLNANGSFAWGSRFGGASDDVGWDIALDASGHVFVVGTATTNFPVYNHAGFTIPEKLRGATNNVFVAGFNTDGSGLVYSLLFGGSGNDMGYGIAVDPAGNAYITGRTLSTNFPVAAPFYPSLLGGSDAFLSKIAFEPVLRTASATGQIELKWRAYAPEYRLETSPGSSPGSTWAPVQGSPFLKDGWHTITLGPTNQGGFFRLKRQDSN